MKERQPVRGCVYSGRLNGRFRPRLSAVGYGAVRDVLFLELAASPSCSQDLARWEPLAACNRLGALLLGRATTATIAGATTRSLNSRGGTPPMGSTQPDELTSSIVPRGHRSPHRQRDDVGEACSEATHEGGCILARALRALDVGVHKSRMRSS
jgi:hypothetical protein